MAWVSSREMIGRMLQSYVQSRAFYLLLTNNSTYTETSSLADIVKHEVVGSNGYTRKQYVPPTGTYDTVQSRYELAGTPINFKAEGGFIQYDRAVLISNGSATAHKTFVVSPSDNRLTVVDHGLANGDKVVPTADAGGELPAGMESQLAYVKVINSSTIELYSDSALTTITDFSSTGSGTLRLRYASGNFELYGDLGSTTIPDGAEQTIFLSWNHGSAVADVNSP